MGRRRTQPRHREPYSWLGAGAITLGVGVALVGGTGVAHAEDSDSGSRAQSSRSSVDSDRSGDTGETSSSSHQDSSAPDADKSQQGRSGASRDDASGTEGDSSASTRRSITASKESTKSRASEDEGLESDTEDSDTESGELTPIRSSSEAVEPASTNFESTAPPTPDFGSIPAADDADSASEEAGSYPSARPAQPVVDTTLSSTVSGGAAGETPDPDAPVKASALLTLTGAARRETADSADATAGTAVAVVPASAVTPTAAVSADADTAQTEADREAADAEFNMSLGWIPGVGTVFNGLSLISDLAEFSTAILNGDVTNMVDEIGDMTVDVVGMVPIVGGPLAATIHQLRLLVSGPVNHVPGAVEDVFTMDEDTQLSGSVLTNDTDADGDTLAAALKAPPSHGTVIVSADGSFTYTPAADYDGVDVFTYTVSDGVRTATGTVTITVVPINDAPVASDDAVTLDEDTIIVIPVRANDTDVDHDSLSVVDITAPGHGSAVLGDDGTITYTPTADYDGADSFTYTITDAYGEISTATVALTVNPVNDAPVAGTHDYTIDEDTPVTGNVLTDATDADDDSLTAEIGAAPTHGMVELNPDGSFTYTPTAEYSGADGFTYTVSDGVSTTTATVSLTVNPVNDAPIAGEDAATLDEDTATVIPVLDNDSDAEDDARTVVEVAAPSHGSAVLGEDGTITYTPAADFNGIDSFTYTVTDGQGGTTTATVTLTINPVSDAPVAVTDGWAFNQDTQLTGNVLGNDFDPDGDPLTVALSGGPAHGNVSLNADGSFAYNPAGGYSGGDSFSYTITDSTGATATTTVNLTIHHVAPPQPPAPTLQQVIAAKTAQFVQNFQGKVWGSARYGSTAYTNPNSLTNNTSSPYYTPDLVGECVSLVTQYLKYTFGITPGLWGNADAWAAGRSGGNQMAANGFVWHTNTSFQNGDILVYNSVHIGIYYNGQLFDSNSTWNGRGANGVGGWAARHAGFSPLGGKIGGYVGYWRKAGA